MRRFQVTIVYEVDTSSKADGGQLGQHLSQQVFAHVCGEDTNLVTETDFRFQEITHPRDSDRVQRP